MSRFRRAVQVCLLVSVFAMVVGASAASATTFYVNGGVAASGDCLTPGSACKTINEAVVKARAVLDTATIDVAAGIYTEDLELTQNGDSGLTINGAGSGASGGTIIQGVNGETTIVAGPLNEGPTTLNDLRIVNPVGDTESAIAFNVTPGIVHDVTIDMQDPANKEQAIASEQAHSTFDQLTVGGAWTGPAIVGVGGVTITRSTLTTTSSPAAVFVSGTIAGGHADLISDSTVQSGPSAPFNIEGVGVDLTVDSSLLLGGVNIGIEWIHPYQKQRNLTIAGSTIDAGTLGVRDPSTVTDLFAVVAGPAGSTGNAQIQGSILMEQQSATIGATDQLTITCSYSDVPNQTQAAKSGEGAINCANGVNGNTTTAPSALFVTPGSNYNLLPGSPAVDGVPAGAISLPFGIAPSTADLAGNPRVVDGNVDCAPVQDKGAFELQGHSIPCPIPIPPAPVAGAITGLTTSPSAFLAAPSGATTSKTKKKTYGATVSYKDSQVATTTFTVLKPSSGRTQGKACKKPSKANKHGKHCTIYTAVGSFTHTDTAGTNKFHFSGRLKGKKLGKGSYKLQAVPHNAAGNGKAVSKEFKVK